MKNMIKTVAVAGLAIVAALAMAQQGGSRTGARGATFSEADAKQMINIFRSAHVKALGSIHLSADQKKKAAAIDGKHLDKFIKSQMEMTKDLKSAKGSNGQPSPALQKKAQASMGEYKAWQDELKKALGAAKYKEYQTAFQKEIQTQMQKLFAKKGKG